MKATIGSGTYGGVVAAAIILTFLLVLFSCTVDSDPVGYSYYQDDSGYIVTVEVSKDAPIPPDWTCYTRKDQPKTLSCDVRVEGAQGRTSEDLTEQEIRVLVQEEVERIRERTEPGPQQGADQASGAPRRDWFDWSTLLSSWAAVGLAALATFTQRKRFPSMIAGMRRALARRRDAGSGRVVGGRVVGSGPGPLYHSGGRRPVRRYGTFRFAR